jgi:acetolactate synthase-1/2/3 large subunit
MRRIAPRTIRYAFTIAKSARPGPVLVDITKDAQQARRIRLRSRQAAPGSSAPYAEARGIRPAQAAELIRNAQRPVILAGHGIIESGAMEQVRTLAERAGIPVALTLLGLGALPASHPLNLGMMGMHGESWVNHAIQERRPAACLRHALRRPRHRHPETFAPRPKRFTSRWTRRRSTRTSRSMCRWWAICAKFSEICCRAFPSIDRSAWLESIDDIKGDSAVRDIKNLPDSGHLYAAHVIHDIWRITDGKAIVVTDVGQHQMWEAQYYKHDEPRTLITSGGLGTMGFALPAAIGAKTACPDKEVWVIAGDGGFQMTSPELSTIAQEGIKINIAIINNGYLGMVRQWQEFFYERNYQSTPLISPDFVKLAAAHGIEGRAVHTRAEVADAVGEARSAPGAFLLNFMVEKEDSVYPMIPVGNALHEMIRRPKK